MNKGSLPQFWTRLRSFLGDLYESLQVKRNLAPVPNKYYVIRLARPPKDYLEKRNVLAIQLNEEFELSTEDKKGNPPHLSVWAEPFTTPEQAYGFLQENAPNSPRKLVLRLKTHEVHQIIGSSGEGKIHSNLLNVIWVHLKDRRPGAKGHCGITGLDEKSMPEGLTRNQAKLLRKDLRSKLAELASKNPRLLDD